MLTGILATIGYCTVMVGVRNLVVAASKEWQREKEEKQKNEN